MQIESWEEFRREMATLCEAYDRKHTKEIDDAYWSALGKMQLKDFKRSAQFAREKAGQDGMDRLPKPGKFWALIDEIRRNEKPLREAQESSGKIPHDAHMRALVSAALRVAKAETQPHFRGFVQRIVPDRFQNDYDKQWAEWDATLGREDDEFWMPRVNELIKLWGGKNSKSVDFGSLLQKIA
jgi:hypothetical protein